MGFGMAGAAGAILSPTFVAAAGGAEDEMPRVSGRLIAVSDVASLPDAPLSAGLVFAVAAERFAALVRESTTPVVDPDEIATIVLTLGAGSFASYAQASSVVGGGGRYELALAPGAYVLCIANLTREMPARPPFHVSGCVRVSVLPRRQARIDLGFGEMGAVVLPEKERD